MDSAPGIQNPGSLMPSATPPPILSHPQGAKGIISPSSPTSTQVHGRWAGIPESPNTCFSSRENDFCFVMPVC